ncbi:MAG: hypothetical protein JWO44_1591 [Bacteroidetes bacterium]|nr:hypothetical protein [Bacteroidota bacterium]
MNTRLRNFIYIFFVLLFCSNTAYSQLPAIKGIITDRETKQAVEDVIISIDEINSHTHSDATGTFSFAVIPAGTYMITFNKLGYETQKLIVNLPANETKELGITLVFNPNTLSVIDIQAERAVSAASSAYLSKVDFENRPKNSAQDMLRLVPGLFIAQHAGGGKAEQIFIRGFDCDHGTDVATFVDGIPVNMPSHGHGQGYEDLHFLIPETVKGMEIFKGPYSPEYGDFATGAAVQFNTMDTLENNLFQLEGGYVPNVQDITSKRALAMIEVPRFSSSVSSYFAAEIMNNRGYFEKSQDFNRFNLFSKTTFSINEHSKLSFSASGFGSSWNASGQVPERMVKTEGISRFGSIDDSEGGATQRNNFNLIYHTDVKGGSFETQVYASNYRFKLFSNFTFFLNDSINGDEIEQDDNRIIRGMNLRYTIPHQLGNMKNKFTAGASFRDDEITNQLWHAVKRRRLEARAHALVHQRSSGIYFNEAFHINEHLRIELGGRYDYFIFDVEDQLPADSIHINYSDYNYQALFSPKLNCVYTATNRLQFFLNAGSGYHSNDARSVVQQQDDHRLPRSVGAEIGSLAHIGNKAVLSAALWWMDLENELVYVGDDGTTENKGSSRRSGIDLSIRLQLNQWLFADAGINVSKNSFTDTLFGKQLSQDYYVPLAPIATSAGGFTMKLKNGFEAGIRYRYMADRPANESNSVIAHGYNIIDFSAGYKMKRVRIGLSIENLLNTDWNEAQFDTESRLQYESQPVDELHFTPGTPFYSKLSIGYLF